ncbi:hypothetical protein NQ317_004221 [Molorchus minor]|uniref:Uncharacterized protein n=1 Tax=Molorchus minor TaxID=1323400 RepID=A0ABQ9JKE5_9CUCU|nr:hypothetical protein NQ317_004221 [Molorchus minor]
MPKSSQNRCAPVHLGFDDSLCCPDTWVCPSPSDEIKQINEKSNLMQN